jgi:hypothetical protein
MKSKYNRSGLPVRISTGLAAALTLGLFSLPGVSRADVMITNITNF